MSIDAICRAKSHATKKPNVLFFCVESVNASMSQTFQLDTNGVLFEVPDTHDIAATKADLSTQYNAYYNAHTTPADMDVNMDDFVKRKFLMRLSVKHGGSLRRSIQFRDFNPPHTVVDVQNLYIGDTWKSVKDKIAAQLNNGVTGDQLGVWFTYETPDRTGTVTQTDMQAIVSREPLAFYLKKTTPTTGGKHRRRSRSRSRRTQRSIKSLRRRRPSKK